MGDRGDRRDIRDSEKWIARRLGPDEARLATRDLVEPCRRGQVDEENIECAAGRKATEQSLRSAVAVMGSEHGFARLHELEYERHGGHASGCDDSSGPALELRERVTKERARRVAAT